jgi:Protein of unknown function (DUF2934)
MIAAGMFAFEEIDVGNLAQRRAPMSRRAKSKTVDRSTPDAIEKQSESLDSSAGDAAVHDEIQLRAYCIYIERGGQHGCEFDDWLQAEREITQEHRAGCSDNHGAH